MDLDEYAHTYIRLDRQIGLMQANGHWLSRWPPGTALFCLPFYALPVALGSPVPSVAVDVLAKLTASTLTAASALFVFLCLRRFASRRGATWMTIAYALGGLLPALFLVGYNVHYFGTPGFGGYQEIVGGGWNLGGLPKAFLGLLVSPNRGMLIFSPFLLFCIYGAGVGLRQQERCYRTLALALVVGLISHLLLTASWRAWHAIVSYGSRYSTDALPYLALCGGFAIDRIRSRPLWRRLFATTVVASILIHSLAVYWDVYAWNRMIADQKHLELHAFEDAAWSTDHPQILWQARFALGLLDED
jgi:hypothetical protein